MDMKRLMRLSFALVVAVCAGGQALAQEPPPVERPDALPRPPEVQTFAFCGAGTTCDCDHLVDLPTDRNVDLLPHRSAAGFAAWLSQQPSIPAACRDRSDL
jgi:hypothetical protein